MNPLNQPGSGATHTCPGGCGAEVAPTLFACKRCWYRLPRDLRLPIWSAYTVKDWAAHSEAMTDAMHWYAEEAAREADAEVTRWQ